MRTRIRFSLECYDPRDGKCDWHKSHLGNAMCMHAQQVSAEGCGGPSVHFCRCPDACVYFMQESGFVPRGKEGT